MSINRSVQAAQRRRAGPTNTEPAIPGRSPQPSINSAQMFANQSRPGNGPNIPNGRLAGQQAALQQQQNQQAYQQSQQNQQNQQAYQQEQKIDKLSSVNKMTIPQAITLITLRLGAIESKMMHMPEGIPNNDLTTDTLDTGFIQSIMSRLESLEKRSSSTSGTPEINLLKQQFENIKQTVVQTKNSVATLVKENMSLKTQIHNVTNELTETKELLAVLQNLTMEHSQKILDIYVNNEELHEDTLTKLNEDFKDNIQNDTTQPDEHLQHHLKLLQYEENHFEDDYDEDEEIVGTNLKKLIESELHM